MTDFDRRDRLMAQMTPPGMKAVDFVLLPEARRMEAIRVAATPPAACGPAVTMAPARGFHLVTNPIGMVPRGVDGWEAQPIAFRGRSVLKRGDVFDDMNAKARAAGRPLPFDEGQLWIARRYRALTEGRDAGGVKCSSMGGGGGGGDGGESARDFMYYYMEDGKHLAKLVARIGVGASMVVRRVRPSARGDGARVDGARGDGTVGGARAGVIMDRVLVDMVCLDDKTPSQVLTRHGCVVKGEYRAVLRGALAAVLDRMQGVR